MKAMVRRRRMRPIHSTSNSMFDSIWRHIMPTLRPRMLYAEDKWPGDGDYCTAIAFYIRNYIVCECFYYFDLIYLAKSFSSFLYKSCIPTTPQWLVRPPPIQAAPKWYRALFWSTAMACTKSAMMRIPTPPRDDPTIKFIHVESQCLIHLYAQIFELHKTGRFCWLANNRVRIAIGTTDRFDRLG